MNNAFLQQLINWPRSYISGVDLKILLDGTSDAKKALIKRAVQEGYLERLKRDYYLIRNIRNKPMIDPFELAQLIYGPSYIGFESTLSHHGWIPERVTTTCSATIKQAKSFDTQIGRFSFEKIPNAIFSLGVIHISEVASSYFIADPWKAIADIIYCRKKSWGSISNLMGDLRIEEESIENSNLRLLELLSTEYPHKQTRKIISKFYQELR